MSILNVCGENESSYSFSRSLSIYIHVSVEEFDISCFLFFQYATTLVIQEMLLQRVEKKQTIEELFSLH